MRYSSSSLFTLLLVLLAGLPGMASGAGTVEFARGVVTAEQPGRAPRVLGRGDALQAADVVETARGSYALLRLDDGTRMTLRPGTRLELEARAEPEPDSVLLGLLKGGLRMVSGLLGKSDRDALRVRTPVATIGIRGTAFDARLCDDDCALERAARGAPEQPGSGVAGRAVTVNGDVRVGAGSGALRRLTVNGPVLQGDVVITGEDGLAVLVFRDGTAVTLQPRTRFQVERFEAAEDQENVLLRLFRGGLRMVTGLVARRSPAAFGLVTPVATIGIRGTGFDVRCEGECAAGEPVAADVPAQELGLHVYVWDGAVSVDAAEACDSVLVSAGQAAAQRSATDCPRRLQGLPGFLRDNPAPRPDRVPFDLEELFGTVALDGGERGLYVQVRDGHVIIEQPGGSVHLGANETGYAAPGGERPLRVALAPGIIFEERYPRPEAFDPRVQRIIELFDDGGGTDIGGFGRLECTID